MIEQLHAPAAYNGCLYVLGSVVNTRVLVPGVKSYREHYRNPSLLPIRAGVIEIIASTLAR